MKSKDFDRKPSSLRVLEEFKPKRKGFNWDRTIYLSVLILGFGYLCFSLFQKHFVITGEGQVLFKKLDIQFTDDVEIIHILKKEGDEVVEGDSLFYYLNEKAKVKVNTKKREVVTEKDSDEWIDREIIQTRKKIELMQIQIAEANRLTGLNEIEKDRVKKAVYLDLYHADKLDIYFQRATRLDSDIKRYENEGAYLKEYLELLIDRQKFNLITRQTIYESSSPSYFSEVYCSPVTGMITRIYKENFEVALESDVIMSIHKPSNLYIKAFFKPKDVEYIFEGDLVDLKFPDGTNSIGILQRFYAATYTLPAEFQKKYEPATRSISADIIPLNDRELEKWGPFYKLNVKITKHKFQMPKILRYE